jgi:dihydrofolate reductase
VEPLRCSAFLAMSLDGFIARPDGRLDWLAPFEAEDHGYQPFFDAIEAIVVGRRTYDTVLGFERWPYAGKRCFVLTHRPVPASHGEEFLAGTPPEVVAQLARAGVRRVYVDGGTVVSAFLAADLLDDLTVSIVPVVLGSGIRLFQGYLPGNPATLESCRALPSGVVQLTYRTRSPGTGTR